MNVRPAERCTPFRSRKVAPASAHGPLEGLLVADFGRALAAPYATMLLADLGAEVIKVESPRGDETRGWLPPVRDGVSTYFLAINRNKRSIVLDFDKPADLELAHELTRRADVLVENFKPGGLRRFALDYDSVRERNPAVVYASITGFGSANDTALPGYDILAQGMSGLMSLTGEPDGPPLRTGMSTFDVYTGLQALVGVLAALHDRQRTGQGQRVEVDLLSTALSVMANQTSAFVAANVIPTRIGNGHPSIFPYDPMPTADGHLIVVAANDAQFRTLSAALGVAELADDDRFATAPSRNVNRDALRPLLVRALAADTSDGWFDRLRAVGVPCGPVSTVAGGIEHATRLGLDPVTRVGSDDAAVPTVRNPIRLSRTPAAYHLPPPSLDQDGEEVRAWLRR